MKPAFQALGVLLAIYVICAIVTWFVFLRMQSARASAGETIGRTTAPVPA